MTNLASIRSFENPLINTDNLSISFGIERNFKEDKALISFDLKIIGFKLIIDETYTLFEYIKSKSKLIKEPYFDILAFERTLINFALLNLFSNDILNLSNIVKNNISKLECKAEINGVNEAQNEFKKLIGID